jgi:hypothetical protein
VGSPSGWQSLELKLGLTLPTMLSPVRPRLTSSG